MIEIAKENGWQIYDTGSGEMIDLDNPARNGLPNLSIDWFQEISFEFEIWN